MTRWLVLALCLVGARAHADDDEPLYKCKSPDPKTDVMVTFHGDPPVRDVVTWLMGVSCKNVVIDPAAVSTTVKIPNRTFKAAEIEATVIAALEAAKLAVTVKGDTLVIARAGKRPCPEPVAGTLTASADARSCKPKTAKLLLPFKPERSVAELAEWLATTTCKRVRFGAGALKTTILAPNRYTPKQAVALVTTAIEAVGLRVKQGRAFEITLGPDLQATCAATSPKPGG